MSREIPDVVLPEPILPPTLAFQIGREAQEEAEEEAYDEFCESLMAEDGDPSAPTRPGRLSIIYAIAPFSAAFPDPAAPSPLSRPLAYILHEAAKSPKRAAVLRRCIVVARDLCLLHYGELGDHEAALGMLDRFLSNAVYA